MKSGMGSFSLSSGEGGTLKFDFPQVMPQNESATAPAGAGREPDERSYLEFVLESIKRVQNYAGGYLQAFLVNQMAQDAMVWRLRVLAHWAANAVSVDEKRTHPNIPWGDIAGLEKVTGREWDHVDIHRVWILANEHLEPLKRLVQQRLRSLD